MASVSATLGAPTTTNANYLQWQNRDAPVGLLDASSLSSDADPRYILRLRLYRSPRTSGQIYFNATRDTPDGSNAFDSGDDLSGDWEVSATAITLSAPNGDFVSVGPNHPDATGADDTEPYEWNPSNIAGLDAWITGFLALTPTQQSMLTLTLDDGVTANTAPSFTSLTANPTSVGSGGTITLTPTVSDAEDDTADLVVTYSSDNGGTFSGNTFTAPTVTQDRTVIITGTVTDTGGLTATATVTVTVTAAALTGPDYKLEVDWDNDGSYGNAESEVWPKVIEGTFRCQRGRNFASQRTGRSVAGSLEVQLDNRDGLFDPDNTMSVLTGLVAGGRRVRWQMDDGTGTLVTQWTGWLRTIEQIDRYTGLDRVRLRALGVISRLNPAREGQQQQVVVRDQETNITVENAAIKIFDPAGSIGSSDAVVNGVDYRASYINGDRELARWWAARPRLAELRDLEQAEGGFLWEPKDGFIALDNADNRLVGATARTSQATFTDEQPAAGEIPAIVNGIKPEHPHEDLANIITSQIQTYGVGSQQVLWSVADLPIVDGADFTIIARYPNENTPSTSVAVQSWTPLASGTDYTPQAGVTLTMTTEGNEATIRVQNTGAATTMDIQVRGTPVIRSTPIEITTPDQDSVDEHGPVAYPHATPWLSNPSEVASLHAYLLRIYSQPAERLTLTWEAGSDLGKATTLDASHRVTVKRRGTTIGFFIESVRHRVPPDFHFITYTLSPALRYGEIFVFGQSAFGAGVFGL